MAMAMATATATATATALACNKRVSFSEASVALCNEFRHAFPQVHVSRRLSRKVHTCASAVDVDIGDYKKQIFVRSEDDEGNRQMLKCEGTADKDRCIDDDVRCVGGHVPLGDDGDDDDDACLRSRSVFHISFDCLDSQFVGTEDEMHIASRVG